MNDDDRLPASSHEDDAQWVAPPDGTLVISAWNEPNQPHGFRARLLLRQRQDAHPTLIASADPEEVLDVVRRWLFAQSGPPVSPEPGG